MSKTVCHSEFSIQSAGEICDRIGFVAAENSFFDPDEITKMLGIRPFETRTMGTPRKNGHGTYPFSIWSACRQEEPVMDAQEQCLSIVRELTPHIPTLNRIRELYNVSFTIQIAPHIYHEEAPILWFDHEIIEFCHRTKTEISVDLYIYDRE